MLTEPVVAVSSFEVSEQSQLARPTTRTAPGQPKRIHRGKALCWMLAPFELSLPAARPAC